MPRYSPEGSLPCITIDCTIFGFDNFALKVLLVKRDIEPQKGMWALPGGWVGDREDLDDAARRILEEATNLKDIYMDQVKTFGRVDRFPDNRILTVSYAALINPLSHRLQQGPEVSDVKWMDVKEVPPLTFDHGEILQASLNHLKQQVRMEPISFELLPAKFTIPQILGLYESILDTKLDRRNFRKKLLRMNILEKLEEKQTGGAHRAADLYRFDRANYERLIEEEGFVYDF
ncbi:NrtR DNA-binding winged helix domain-containing protein [Pontibacter sp. G13]|uniref:NUDIX hydrolase n=1 Tax=Pontibacter sp. G13 TaxID=3074898 RepID=UPI00288B5C19|nr:NUDIX domain-containing protein [Pontibacter sp. G13]WNJ21606.1 NUDIX domain-containing protein [Pontibacter sp. G13]